MARVLYTIFFSFAKTKDHDWKPGDGTMPENTMRIDRHMLGTRLDRLATQKVTEILNAMLDTEADEIVGRPDTSVPAAGRRTARAVTSTCPGLKARRRKRTDHRATGGHDQKVHNLSGTTGFMGVFCLSPTTSSVVRKGSRGSAARAQGRWPRGPREAAKTTVWTPRQCR